MARVNGIGSIVMNYIIADLYEAAIEAHYQATVKEIFSTLQIKNADLIDKVSGPEKDKKFLQTSYC